jgi:tRNA-dihydrouridine synthase B
MKKRMRAVLLSRGGEAGAGPQEAPAGPNPLAEGFSIDGLRLGNRIVQAPLAGIANSAFRLQSQRHGAGLAVSEMVAALGIVHRNRKTLDMLRIDPAEGPTGVQIFGAEPGAMAEAARVVADAGADFVDINMGCPVRKVCTTGAGAAMLADPDNACRVIRAMADAVGIPVTVKMRRGLTPASAAPVELARRFADAGARALFVHPRAAAEEYEGTADHRITAEVVGAVDIPVIASGDVLGPVDARRVLAQTGCAAVAIGRGALGYPWIFSDLIRGTPRARPPLEEVVDEVLRFAADVRVVLGDRRACGYMRKFYPWYLAGSAVGSDELACLLRAEPLDDALGLLRALAGVPAPA